MENVGADRAPGMVEKFRLTAVSWSRTITVLSSHATNNEGKGRYVLEEFSICSFTDYKKVGKLLSCRKYYRYRVILTKTFLYVDSFTRWKLCNNPFVKTTLHLWSVPRRSTSFKAKFSKLMQQEMYGRKQGEITFRPCERTNTFSRISLYTLNIHGYIHLLSDLPKK